MKYCFRQRVAFLLVLLMTLQPTAALAAPATAPPAQDVAGGQLGDFLVLFPTLARLPAPEWLGEGVRATYASASATTAGNNDTDTAGGGAGLMQYDVVATERRTVATYSHFYLDLGDGTVQDSFSAASVTGAGVGDFWLNPTVLATADDLDIDGLAVYHMPYSAAGIDFNAIRFQYEGDGSTRVWMFDEASGLLLFQRDDVALANEAHQLSQMTLEGIRTLKLPWKAGGPAFTLKHGDGWAYEGAFSTIISGSPVIPLPMSTQVTVTKNRPRWTLTSNESSFNGQSSGDTSGITGAGQLFGGIWLPAGALTARPPRAVIDTDPLTGATVRFARANGAITITESGASWSTALIYDAETGLFIGMHKEMQVGIATNIYDLQLVQ